MNRRQPTYPVETTERWQRVGAVLLPDCPINRHWDEASGSVGCSAVDAARGSAGQSTNGAAAANQNSVAHRRITTGLLGCSLA